MDQPLRVAIWNAIHASYFNDLSRMQYEPRTILGQAVMNLWAVFLQQPLDRLPSSGYALAGVLRDFVHEQPWDRVYDLLEWFARFAEESDDDAFPALANAFLTNEKSGYRVVGREVAPIADAQQMRAVGEAATGPVEAINKHLNNALRLLSDRATPDYVNSVKESITAVESACQHVLGKKVTAGEGLKKLKDELNLHPALADGFSKLYGFTSTAGGIRHANHGDDNHRGGRGPLLPHRVLGLRALPAREATGSRPTLTPEDWPWPGQPAAAGSTRWRRGSRHYLRCGTGQEHAASHEHEKAAADRTSLAGGLQLARPRRRAG
jgi:hypothetical protein